MKVAIVEDEMPHAEALQELLRQWSEERQVLIDVALFGSGEAISSACGDPFDLVFMDIQMDGMNGISVARQLRQQDFHGQLVFLTSFSEYVFDGYEVQALNYFMKPVPYEKIAKCMDYVEQKLHDDHYTFRDHDLVTRIAYSKIIYFCSANHYTQIITTEGDFRQRESLQIVFSHLPSRFLFCHRTIIINMEHISKLKGRELVLSNGVIVPISQTYLQDVRSALMSYADMMR
ncbi:LytTR family DNA-binding domain-containing protein [Oscillibacter sp.]|uniref:LytR/AlgR family response regulator transcription factor n=1 Tax=Oscillibacter sp. TaxID=1945593 RepID=UPI00289A20C6|nr:LytTR family DNA-binding domain-containing protein [Oscillibacter sp.]